MILRPYQQNALDAIRQHFGRGRKRVLLHLATGGGKTVVFCKLLKLVQEKGNRAVMVVHGRQLVAQASERLHREGVEHGVIMGNHWNKNAKAQIQICSIDTLYRRKDLPDFNLLVIDECHMATSDGYRWLLEQSKEKFVLGVTATPYHQKGLGHVGEVVVKPVSMNQLIADGFLVGPKYYAPSTIDTSNVKIIQGEFHQRQLAEAAMRSKLTGDLVDHWLRLAKGRPTLAFAVSVEHSKLIAATFNNAGIRAEHIDAETCGEERTRAFKALERGDISVLSNCGVLTTGFDCPPVSCLVVARPTMSYALHVQILGRGTRPYPGKSDFIVLDHAGNLMKHGCILEEREATLDPMPKGKAKPPGLVSCPDCYAVYAATAKACPACEAVNLNYVDRRAVPSTDRNKDLLPADLERMRMIARKNQLKDKAKRKGYKRGWAYHQFKREFGEELAAEFFPQRNLPGWLRRQTTKS